MAEEVVHIVCAGGSYTQISLGHASVSFDWREEMVYGRWCFGDTEPAPDTLDYKTLRPKQPVSLNELSATTRIWVRPEGADDQIIEVVRS